MYDVMSTVPDSHLSESSEDGKVSLAKLLKHIHMISQSLRINDGLDSCPVFDEKTGGCPFKRMTKNGTPFVKEMEYKQWLNILTKSAAQDPVLALSKELKEGTRKSHKEAENVHFVKDFVRGKIERNSYVKLLGGLYHVYSSMEEELDGLSQHNAWYRDNMHFPNELRRSTVLLEDWQYFTNSTSVPRLEDASDCTKEYVQRLHELGKSKGDSILLLAHTYTRYLGDLSGGRVLGRVLRRTFSLPEEGQGWAFYRFDLIKSPNKFKVAYRKALDTIPLGTDGTDVDRIVDEANVAFLMNMRIFSEIDYLAGKATSRPNSLSVAIAEMRGRKIEEEDKNKCPFLNPAQKSGNEENEGQCPFPFVLLHDPKQGMERMMAALQNPLQGLQRVIAAPDAFAAYIFVALIAVIIAVRFYNQL